jgi:hypothetical protein
MMNDAQPDLGHAADACYARWSYERVQLLQPHIAVNGLWAHADWFYVVCRGFEPSTLALDGKPLEEWFRDEGKAVGSPTRLASEPPPGAVLVPERTVEERLNLIGAPLTVRNIVSVLSLSIPNSFPPFDFKTQPPIATLFVARALMPYEEVIFGNAIAPYLGRMKLEVVVDEARFGQPLAFRWPSFMQGDIDLLPARRLPNTYSSRVKGLIEADEDSWAVNRHHLLGLAPKDIPLPPAVARATSSCLIEASAFVPRNLRMAIALYGQVQISMPLASAYDSVLGGFQVTEAELVQLAERGRVVFLLPQSIDRYPASLVQRLADLQNDAMIMSRALAGFTIQERRRRIPLLHAPLSATDRHRILAALAAVADPQYRSLPRALAGEFGRVWSSSEESLTFRGAMSVPGNGIGQIVATMVESLTGRELRLEMLSAAMGVEWASALGSTIIPHDSEPYSEQALTEILAGAYSGVENRAVPTRLGDVEIAVLGILSIDNDAPVLDLAQAFSGDDVDRMRKLAFSVNNHESVSAAVEIFNRKVSHYERDVNRLARLDLLTLVGAAAALPMAAGYPVAGWIPLGAWITKYLLQNADVTLDAGGQIAERLRAINSFTSRDVVMVSRLRKSIRESGKPP